MPFKECAVAGLSFHLEHNDELWDELVRPDLLLAESISTSDLRRIITPRDHRFLLDLDLKDFEAIAYLHRSLSDGFNGIFRYVLSGTLDRDQKNL